MKAHFRSQTKLVFTREDLKKLADEVAADMSDSCFLLVAQSGDQLSLAIRDGVAAVHWSKPDGSSAFAKRAALVGLPTPLDEDTPSDHFDFMMGGTLTCAPAYSVFPLDEALEVANQFVRDESFPSSIAWVPDN